MVLEITCLFVIYLCWLCPKLSGTFFFIWSGEFGFAPAIKQLMNDSWPSWNDQIFLQVLSRYTNGFSSVIKGMLKRLFSRHVPELQLSVEFRMQMPSSAVSVCLFLGQEINEHYVSRGLSSSTENFSNIFWLGICYIEYWKWLRATLCSVTYYTH